MSRTRSWRLTAVSLVACVALAACGSSEEEVTPAKDGLGCAPARVEPATDSPEIEPVAEVPTEVATDDVEVGEGCTVNRLPYVSLHIKGATADDAEVFVDSYADERPVTVAYGQGELVTGLETGLEGLKVGGRRTVTVPAELAYGAEGNPEQGIGPDEALVFVVDLVAVSRTRLYCREAAELPVAETPGKPESVEVPLEVPESLVTDDITEGTGPAIEEGDYVTLNYVGVSCTSGRQFDSSWDNGTPFSVTVGQGTIAGFADGLVGMKEGGRRRIVIPSRLGYGPAGQPPDIAADDPLVFVLDVLAVSDSAPTTTAPPEGPVTTVAGDPAPGEPGDTPEPATPEPTNPEGEAGDGEAPEVEDPTTETTVPADASAEDAPVTTTP